MTSLIIILVIIAILAGVIVYFVLKAKHAVEDFSRAAFGTSSLKEGFKQVEQEYASTPKSVAAVTSLYLPKIHNDFPDFSYDEMKEKAKNAITSYLLACDQNNASLLQEGNQELRNKLDNVLLNLNNVGQTEHFEQVHLHRMELSGYKKQDGRCIITFQCSLEALHYVSSKDAYEPVSGRTDLKEQMRYEADLIYIQDRSIAETDLDGTLGLNCPNCGAPLTSLGAKKCPYCDTPIIELNIHAWSFSDVRQA